ncbi:hypothetical protein [Streptomyces sp. ISL-99]|nr:hypothetical protein [Streptomyces sp. ISL-99]
MLTARPPRAVSLYFTFISEVADLVEQALDRHAGVVGAAPTWSR